MHPMAHTDRQTHGHGDSMTNSAQWGRVGEEEKKLLALCDKIMRVNDNCLVLQG